MQALKCPQCGAPIQGAAGEPFYHCPFCKHTSRSDASMNPPAPQFVIVQHVAADPPPSAAAFTSPTPASASRSRVALLPVFLPFLVPVLILTITFRQELQNLTGIGAWDGDEPLVCDGNESV